MTQYLGKLHQEICTTSTSSANQSILITGVSGSGKTCRMQQMELEAVCNGQTIIVMDTNHNHDPEQIYTPIRSEYEAFANRISALRDGIDIHLFSSNEQTCTPDFMKINSITQMISRSANLGVNQTKLLRNAVSNAFHNYTSGTNELQSIGSKLKSLSTSGENLYERLWMLFECNVIRTSQCKIQSQRINILDFSDLDENTQKIVLEIVLSCLWKKQIENGLPICNVVLDEFQRLYLGSSSLVRQLLREGRKFGINLILATQSLSIFPRETVSMLDQAGTKLFFQPAQTDLHRISKSLAQIYGGNWEQPLAQLCRGESIADGILQVGNSTIRRPLKLA